MYERTNGAKPMRTHGIAYIPFSFIRSFIHSTDHAIRSIETKDGRVISSFWTEARLMTLMNNSL